MSVLKQPTLKLKSAQCYMISIDCAGNSINNSLKCRFNISAWIRCAHLSMYSFKYVVNPFCWLFVNFPTHKKHATKNDACTSNFHAVNSDLRPFRQKKDHVFFYASFLRLGPGRSQNMAVVAACPWHYHGAADRTQRRRTAAWLQRENFAHSQSISTHRITSMCTWGRYQCKLIHSRGKLRFPDETHNLICVVVSM